MQASKKSQENYQNVNESKVNISVEKVIMSLKCKIATVTLKARKNKDVKEIVRF